LCDASPDSKAPGPKVGPTLGLLRLSTHTLTYKASHRTCAANSLGVICCATIQRHGHSTHAVRVREETLKDFPFQHILLRTAFHTAPSHHDAEQLPRPCVARCDGACAWCSVNVCCPSSERRCGQRNRESCGGARVEPIRLGQISSRSDTALVAACRSQHPQLQLVVVHAAATCTSRTSLRA